MSDSFIIWSFWILNLAALAYALYSTTLPNTSITATPDEESRG